jgi:hypothetical protein
MTCIDGSTKSRHSRARASPVWNWGLAGAYTSGKDGDVWQLRVWAALMDGADPFEASHLLFNTIRGSVRTLIVHIMIEPHSACVYHRKNIRLL